MRSAPCLLWMFALVCLAPVLRADEVVLKNGRTLKGRVVETTDDKLVLSLDSGSITLRQSDISDVIRDSRARAEIVKGSTSPVIAELVKKWNPNRTPVTRYAKPSTRRVSSQSSSSGGMAGIRRNNAKPSRGSRGR
jgi:hypothetical protein